MIFIIIPAYNEEANIGRAVRETVQSMEDTGREFKIIVVDDGSRDRTREIVEQLGEGDARIMVVSHPVNLGVGQVFRTGFTKAIADAADDDWIVTKEADNTSDIDIFPAMLQQMDNGSDVVLASCYAPGGEVVGTTRSRVFLSAVANALVRILFGMYGVHTFSSFYRIYRARVLRQVIDKYSRHKFIRAEGFSCMVELLVRIKRLRNVTITEVPMVLRGDQRIGASKMKVLRTIGEYFALFIREFGRD